MNYDGRFSHSRRHWDFGMVRRMKGLDYTELQRVGGKATHLLGSVTVVTCSII